MARINGYVINARLALSSGRRDEARDRDLALDGYRVLRVPDSAPNDPGAYAASVRAFLAEA